MEIKCYDLFFVDWVEVRYCQCIGENCMVYNWQISCNFRDEMICYNFRFEEFGMQIFKGGKIICLVLCDKFLIIFIYFLIIKLKKIRLVFILGFQNQS